MSRLGSLPLLSIRRNLDLPGAVVCVDCKPGTITIFNDENGGSLPRYSRALANQKGEERFTLELGGREYQAGEQVLVGFDNDLPEGVSITEYLASNGFGPDEIESIIDTYELRSVHYLHCAQLPETAKRQVQLLVALHTLSPVLVLNDPFMPFNGRWRESFAALLYEHIRASNRICVIINLSFAPKCWLEKKDLQTLDVGVLADKVFKKTQEIITRQEAERERTGKLSPSGGRDLSADLAAQADRELDELTGLPRIAWYAYRETKDFIFDPLARITRMFRTAGGAAAIAGFAFLVLVMGVVMFPYLARQRALISELAGKFDVSWGDIKQAVQQSGRSPSDKSLDIPNLPEGEALEIESKNGELADSDSKFLTTASTEADESPVEEVDWSGGGVEARLLLPEFKIIEPVEQPNSLVPEDIKNWLSECSWCGPGDDWPSLALLAEASQEFSYDSSEQGSPLLQLATTNLLAE